MKTYSDPIPTTFRKQPLTALLSVAVLITVSLTSNRLSATPDGDHAPNPSIVPLQAHYAGLTYAEWAVRWSQWEARTATPNSPALDTTGEHVAEGQSGPVWFLIWSYTTLDPVVRTATIPEGTALMFPATDLDPYFWLPPDTTLEGRRAAAELVFEETVEHHAEVDGVPINDMDAYRVVSAPYTFLVPEDNIIGVPAGEYGPSIVAGYFYLIKPLSVGEHIIHFHYSMQNSSVGDFSEDLTYYLTVSPHSKPTHD